MAGKMSEPVGETLVLARECRPKCFAGELFEVFVQPRGSGGDIFHDDTGGLFLQWTLQAVICLALRRLSRR